MAAQRNSAYITFTRALLTFAAALSLARVFAGLSWIPAIAIASAVPPLVFALGERRRWHPITSSALVVFVGIWLTIVVDTGSATVAGIPTGDAFSMFRRDLSSAPHVLRSAVVPVHIDRVRGSLLLAFLATYVAAAAADLIARRLDAPIGAIGASIALYVAIAALGAGPWALTTACFGAAIVAYLVALHHADIQARRTWFHTTHARRSRLATGGLVAGAVLILLTISIGPSLPGARGAAWLNYRKLGSGNSTNPLEADSPLVSLHAKLNELSNKTMFTVQDGGKPMYWRTIALDDFHDKDAKNGVSDSFGLGAEDPQSPSALQGPSSTTGSQSLSQHFEIDPSLDPYWLPAAYRPYEIKGVHASVYPHTSTLFVTSKKLGGVSYDVTSNVSNPSTDQLNQVTTDDLQGMNADIDLPLDFPADVTAEAHRITDPGRTPYEKAMLLQNYFQSDLFTYDKSVHLDSSTNTLSLFVLHTRRGFCEQFATAYAFMARKIGLPTRVAVGFQTGKSDGHGGFVVKGEDAHAWPEVWFGDQYGWVAFEPTKGRFNPVVQRGDPNAVQGGTTPSTNTTPTTKQSTATTQPRSVTTNPLQPPPVQVKPNSGAQSHTSTGTKVFLGIVALAGAVLLALGAGIGWLVLTARRRTRQRRFAETSRRRVLGAWDEALERLAAAGVEPRASATSLEFALRHAPAHGAGDAGPPLMDLARLHTAAMFSPDPPSDDEADAAWNDVDAIDAALRDHVSRSERWITRLRLRRRDRERDLTRV
jgi:transglutaminase-like putative cysteine protease